MTADILIVAPVLARPQNAEPLVQSLVSMTREPWRLAFVCSPGDTTQIDACIALSVFDGVETLIAGWEPGPGDYARKIQAGYDSGDEPYVLLAADDLRFHDRWDTAALTAAREFDVGVIGTNDRANPAVVAGEHSTHPLVARCYIDAHGGYVDGPGRVYFDGYDHQFVDTELVQTARARGCYAHVHTSIVQHLHPIFDRSVPTDGTYRKGQARGAADRALYESRRQLWERERVPA